MRLCQFGEGRIGVIEGSKVRDATEALKALPCARYPFPRTDLLISNLHSLRGELASAANRSQALGIETIQLHSPVLNPGKILAAPVNYVAHLEEARAEPATYTAAHVRRIEETGLFLKATSSIIGPSSAIKIRHPSRRTDHEIELVAIIGRECSNVSKAEALNYVAGYCIGLDITLRGPEERSLRKSIDTYSVLGPYLVTADEIGDPSGLNLALDVNGERRQTANTRDLILDVPTLIAFASSFYTLRAGDVLFTGTPEGVGPIAAGDTIKATIDGLGELIMKVE
jgi:2,4-diketo-3-deoxy-L-fuconate hydrolase